MSKHKVQYFVWDESLNRDVERPLDDAPPEVIELASLVHGRDLSDATFAKVVQVVMGY